MLEVSANENEFMDELILTKLVLADILAAVLVGSREAGEKMGLKPTEVPAQ